MISKWFRVFGAAVIIGILGVAVRGVVRTAPRLYAPSQRVQAAADVQGQWVSLGPSTIVANSDSTFYNSGRIASIAIDPTDPTHWLIGVSTGGVWETRDAGGSWRPLTDAAPTLSMGDITFDPTNPSTIYAATGDAKGGGLFKGGVGILKSTDGGQSWAVVGASSFARGAVKRIRVNPANPRELVAASARGGFGRQGEDFPPQPPPYGILTSTDAGDTWTRALAGQATALEIDQANFNRQYAAIGEQFQGQTGVGVPANGVYRSTDAGRHWGLMPGPWDTALPPEFAVGAIELAMAPSNPNVVYVSVSLAQGSTVPNQTPLCCLFRTENAWDDAPAWRQLSKAATDSGTGVLRTYCIHCESHVVSVSPSDPNVLFAGGMTLLWRCTDCGSATPQWTNLTPNTAPVHADQRTVAWAGSRLILGNDGGVWSSTDLGARWQNHNASLATLMFYSGALHPTDPNFTLGGFRDFIVSVRRGNSWAYLPQAASSEWGEAEVAISSRHPDTDWMGGWLHGVIQRTTDGGKTTVQVDAAIDKTAAAQVAPVRKCPANDDVFVTGTNRVWRTENFFNSTMPSWSLNGPSDATATSGSIFTINFVATDTNCGTYAYGTNRGEIRLTQDAGRTWVDLDPDKKLPARAIESMAFDPSASATIYVAFSSFNAATSAKPGHIYKTTNALSTPPTWVDVGPSEDQPFDAVEVDPRNPSLVYAGSDTGLWVSGDAGATWQKVGPDRGLPHAAVYDIKINPATNQTVVFTHGRGAFQLVTDAMVPQGGRQRG